MDGRRKPHRSGRQHRRRRTDASREEVDGSAGDWGQAKVRRRSKAAREIGSRGSRKLVEGTAEDENRRRKSEVESRAGTEMQYPTDCEIVVMKTPDTERYLAFSF